MSVTISGSGQIVKQVISTTLNTAFTASSASYTNVTGLSVSITPTNSANRILVFTNLWLGSSNAQLTMYGITRNGTQIANSSFASTNGTGVFYTAQEANESFSACATSMNYLDAPATTSALTYQVQILTTSGGTGYVNRRGNDTLFGGVSTITVMEIAYA